MLTPLRIRRHEANVDRMASGHTSAILCNDPISYFPLRFPEIRNSLSISVASIEQSFYISIRSIPSSQAPDVGRFHVTFEWSRPL